jgi:hypothetical protein
MSRMEGLVVVRASIDSHMSIQHHVSRMPDMALCLCNVPSSALLSGQFESRSKTFGGKTTHPASVTCSGGFEYTTTRVRRRDAWSFCIALCHRTTRSYCIFDVSHDRAFSYAMIFINAGYDMKFAGRNDVPQCGDFRRKERRGTLTFTSNQALSMSRHTCSGSTRLATVPDIRGEVFFSLYPGFMVASGCGMSFIVPPGNHRHRELLLSPSDRRLRRSLCQLQRILEQRTLVTHLFQLLIGVSFPDLLFGKLCVLLVASPQKELE